MKETNELENSLRATVQKYHISITVACDVLWDWKGRDRGRVRRDECWKPCEQYSRQ